MIYKKLLELSSAFVEKRGQLVSITLDETGWDELQGEIKDVLCSSSLGPLPHPDKRRLFGINIEVMEKCPTCGKQIKEVR